MGSLILSHLTCCNARKLQSPWGFSPDPIRWVYSSPYSPTRSSVRENYKYLHGLCPCKVWDFPTALYISYKVKFKHKLNCFHSSFADEILRTFLQPFGNQLLYLCVFSWQLRILSDPCSQPCSEPFHAWGAFFAFPCCDSQSTSTWKPCFIAHFYPSFQSSRTLICWLRRPYSFPQLNF